MMTVRPSNERGYEDKGWLKAYHTFSFDTYYDPEFLTYRSLRVLNEEVIEGGKGFPMHAHRDVEIITYVLDGVLEYTDNTGHSRVIRPYEVICVSAGLGIVHSECNLSHFLPLRFLQFWIQPDQPSLKPNCTQKLFSTAAKWGKWCLILSRNGREGSIRVHQDVNLYATFLDEQDEIAYEALPSRYYWIQIISGTFLIEGSILEAGDGASLHNVAAIHFHCEQSGELLLFDLA